MRIKQWLTPVMIVFIAATTSTASAAPPPIGRFDFGPEDQAVADGFRNTWFLAAPGAVGVGAADTIVVTATGVTGFYEYASPADALHRDHVRFGQFPASLCAAKADASAEVIPRRFKLRLTVGRPDAATHGLLSPQWEDSSNPSTYAIEVDLAAGEYATVTITGSCAYWFPGAGGTELAVAGLEVLPLTCFPHIGSPKDEEPQGCTFNSIPVSIPLAEGVSMDFEPMHWAQRKFPTGGTGYWNDLSAPAPHGVSGLRLGGVDSYWEIYPMASAAVEYDVDHTPHYYGLSMQMTEVVRDENNFAQTNELQASNAGCFNNTESGIL